MLTLSRASDGAARIAELKASFLGVNPARPSPGIGDESYQLFAGYGSTAELIFRKGAVSYEFELKKLVDPDVGATKEEVAAGEAKLLPVAKKVADSV